MRDSRDLPAVKGRVVVDCSIAGKRVSAQPRSGLNILEGGRPYLRCSERDCQYVDLNQPPCPLHGKLSHDSIEDQKLREHLASHRGERFCYGCLVEKLGLTHDLLRRLAWHLRADLGAVIRPGRCVACVRRRLTIAIPAGRTRDRPPTSRSSRAPSSREELPSAADDCARVLAALRTLAVVSCAACIALAAELPLEDTRRAVADLSSRLAVSVDLDGACGFCCRRQAVMTA